MSNPIPFWKPKELFKKKSNMTAYIVWLNKNYKTEISDYQSLWEWSVSQQDKFWESIFKYFNIEYSGNYESVRTESKNMYDISVALSVRQSQRFGWKCCL